MKIIEVHDLVVMIEGIAIIVILVKALHDVNNLTVSSLVNCVLNGFEWLLWR